MANIYLQELDLSWRGLALAENDTTSSPGGNGGRPNKLKIESCVEIWVCTH